MSNQQKNEEVAERMIRCQQDAIDWHQSLMGKVLTLHSRNRDRSMAFPTTEAMRLLVGLHPEEYIHSPRFLARPQDLAIIYKRLEVEYLAFERRIESFCELTGEAISEDDVQGALGSMEPHRASVKDSGPYVLGQSDEITNLIRHLQVLVEDLGHLQPTTEEQISEIVHRDYNPLKRRLWSLAKKHDGTVNWTVMKRLDNAGFQTFTFDGCLWVHVKYGALRGPKILKSYEGERK